MAFLLRLRLSLLLLLAFAPGLVRAAYPPLQITEFMAVNASTIQDQDGDYSGWIEIFNPTQTEVSLTGWRLATTGANAKQWSFPGYVMMPGDYLVVFASAKNRTTVTGELHTNFQMPGTGGGIGLLDPSGATASTFAAYPAQSADVSYGRDPIQPELTGFFSSPTPGQPNVSAGAGVAPKVKFSVAGGAFSTAGFGPGQPLAVALTCSAAGAVIHYTLDGSLPLSTSPVCTNTLALTASTQLAARAFVPGVLPGAVRTETYLQMTPALAAVTSSLPAVVIYDFGAGSIPDAAGSPPVFANLAVYEPVNGVTRLTNAPGFSTGSGISVRGSSTRGLPKQSWEVQFWDALTNSVDFSPVGLPADSEWVFYAPDYFEPVLIHNPLIYQLSNEAGRYAPRTRMVEVYLNTTGTPLSPNDYFGIYVLEEKITRGAERIPVDRLRPTDNTTPAVTGGYMLKIDRTGPGESGLNAAGQTIVYNGPSESSILTPERAPQKTYIQGYMNRFGTALNGASYRDPTNGYAAFIDVGSAIDHHILNVVAFNVDALRLSAYFYKPRSGPVVFGPIWDFDRSQGSTDSRDFNPRIWRSTVSDLGTDFFNYSWWGRFFTDPDFWQKWVDRYQDLRTGVLSTNHIFADIDGLVAQVRPMQPREAARWNGYTTPRSGTVSGSGYSYNFPGTYQGEVNFLKHWYADRLNFIDTNFLARPALSLPGGDFAPGATLTLSGPAGATLYYTLDGSDPRLSGGAVSPTAQAYSAPIPLSVGLVVRTRSYSTAHRNLTGANKPPISTPWSGAVSATYGLVTGPSQVAYAADDSVYLQNFDSLPAPGAVSVNSDNPVTLGGVTYALANPCGFALPVAPVGNLGGLGLSNSLSGWYGVGGAAFKFGAGDGDQTGGGVVSFGPLLAGSTNRALGMIATGGTGPTAVGVRLVNATGHTLDRISLEFTAELWRQTAVPKTLTCGYYIEDSRTNGFPTNFTTLPSLAFRFPAAPAGTSDGPVDGTNPANQQSQQVINQPIADWPAGSALWLVWQLADPASKGQGLALDDLAFSANAAPPPTLQARVSGGVLALSWPVFPGGFGLQAGSGLLTPNNWSAATATVVSTNGTNTALLPVSGAAQFFRLSR